MDLIFTDYEGVSLLCVGALVLFIVKGWMWQEYDLEGKATQEEELGVIN